MKKYECEVCGKSYDSIADIAKCETKCVIERKKAVEELKKQEFEAKMYTSTKAICDELLKVDKMVGEHLKEYNSLSMNNNYPYLKHIFNTSLLWF